MSTDHPKARAPDGPPDRIHRTVPGRPPLTRRALLLGAVAAAATAGCSSSASRGTGSGGATASAPPATTHRSTTTSTPPTTTAPGGPARFESAGPSSPARIALTFHTDGDLGLAGQLLDLLSARHVTVTTFLVGKWVDAHPDVVRRIQHDGHELANHTYSHVTFSRLSPSVMAQEIGRCRDALIRATGTGGRLFRPSGTENGTQPPSDAVLTAAGAGQYPIVAGFDVDPMDYRDPGAAVVTQRLVASIHPGAIVSLHFGHPGTVAALPAVLDAIAARKLQTVTASELLA